MMEESILARLDQPRPSPPGLALYSVRRSFNADPSACLARIQEIGYRSVTARGSNIGAAKTLRPMLESHDLTSPVIVLEGNIAPQEQVEAAAYLGARFVTIPSAPVFFDRTETGGFVWKKSVDSREFAGFCAQLPGLAALCQSAGLNLLYHFHDLDFVPMDDGMSPYDWLSTRVPSDAISFHLDTAWLREGYVDLPGLMMRLAGRIPVLDLKDVNPLETSLVRGANMVPAGEGDIDFTSSIAMFASAGTEIFMVENEPLEDEWKGAISAFQYLANLDMFARDL